MPNNLIPLLTARIRAKIIFDYLNPEIVRTLQWYKEAFADYDEKAVYLEMVDPISSLLRSLIESPELVSDILPKFEGKETKVTVEMVINKQILLLEQIQSAPPKPWHIAKGAFLVSYIALYVFIDIVLFVFITLAAVPIATLEVAPIVAFPKIEQWLKND